MKTEEEKNMEGQSCLGRLIIGSLLTIFIGLALAMLTLMAVNPQPRLGVNTITMVAVVAALIGVISKPKVIVIFLPLILALGTWTWQMTSLSPIDAAELLTFVGLGVMSLLAIWWLLKISGNSGTHNGNHSTA